MDLPTTKQDLESLIKNRVQESLHLDYKGSRAISDGAQGEIAKDVSAFANADGGMIIYGIQENQHLPEAIDEGVDHARFSREWLEQVILDNINPRIDGLLITQIPWLLIDLRSRSRFRRATEVHTKISLQNDTTSDTTSNRSRWRTMR